LHEFIGVVFHTVKECSTSYITSPHMFNPLNSSFKSKLRWLHFCSKIFKIRD